MTATSADTQYAEISRVFAAQQAHKFAMNHSSVAERKAKLRRLHDAMFRYQPEIRAAMWADFHKTALEVDISEIYPVLSEIRTALGQLSYWAEPTPVPTPLLLLGTRAHTRYVGKGVVLLISPWNFPFNLTFYPLVSAIAAGNCVMVKPSEMCPNASALIAKIIREVFEEHEVAVFEGDADTAQALLKLPFNHIFFTGSPMLGKVIMRAAAEHLASVTLELGGKSPTIVDETANLEDAADKICMGKFLNSGQICIAPDYVMVHENVAEKFIGFLKRRIQLAYGNTHEEQITSESYARMVNHRHWQRVKDLLDDAVRKGATVAYGGQLDGNQNYISPTILTGVPMDATVMQEEIFGPLLPVVTFKDIHEAIEIQNSKPTPLSQYVFTRSRHTRKLVLRSTIAGDTCFNDCVSHFANDNLPFGGHNNSGIGKAHGHAGFLEFSHRQGVLRQQTWVNLLKIIYPPYKPLKLKIVQLILKWL